MVTQSDFKFQAFFLLSGFTPITALAIALLDWAPLHVTAPIFVLPVFVFMIVIGYRHPLYGERALRGWMAGVIATFVYDGTRVPFLMAGMWQDFIPKIGDYLLNTEGSSWIIGYLWRYLGNGGGMGIGFAMIVPWLCHFVEIKRGAVCYGVAIWGCLMLTLVGCPDPERMLFAITPLSFILSLLGHIVYGALLGIQFAGPSRRVSKSSFLRGRSSFNTKGERRPIPAGLWGER